MRREYIDYVQDILDAINKIEEFIFGMTFEQFNRDEKTVFATIRAFEVIGEATNKLPSEIRSRYPDISWQDITGMRNKLIHEYFGVDTEVVWKTIKEDLPNFKSVIVKILEDIKHEAEEKATQQALEKLSG